MIKSTLYNIIADYLANIIHFKNLDYIRFTDDIELHFNDDTVFKITITQIK